MNVALSRTKLGALVRRVERSQERAVVTRRGKAVVAMIPAADLEALEALEDAEDVRAARGALADPEPSISLEEYRRLRGWDVPPIKG